MRQRSRSLLWRFGAAIIGTHLLLLIALGVYVFLTVGNYHREQQRDELRRLADVLVDRYATLVAAGAHEPDLQARAVADRNRSGARVTLVMPDGRVAADSHADPAAMENHRLRPEVRAALEDGSGAQARFSETLQQRLLYFARPVPSVDGPPSVLRVALPLAGIDAELQAVWGTLAVAAGISLVVTSLVIVFIARRLSETIGQIADGASRFAAGELGHRIPRPKTREMARLAVSLNAMARQLDDRIAQLQRQDAEQHAILQSMSNGVLALDPQQHVLSVNRAAEQILGLERSEVRGKLLPAVAREPTLIEFVDNAIRDRQMRAAELELGPDRRRIIRITSQPLTDPRGTSAGLLVVLDDITELRRLERLRSDFAANVSHELRTPITNIKGYVETLQETGLDDHQQSASFLKVIKENSDRLAAIIEDILALARIEEPGAADQLSLEPTRVRALLHTVMAQFRQAAAGKSIELRCVVDDPALEVRVQRQLMEQALGNLLSNAINYSPAETAVTLGGRRRDDGRIELSVVDEGPGIASDHVPRLFERFYRVDKGRSRELGGTGLGLAIVKHVALLHGGQAEVSTAPGAGSTFCIVVPDQPPVPSATPTR